MKHFGNLSPVIIYRLLSPIIGLAYILRSHWAILRRGEQLGDLGERFTVPRYAQPTIWVHGASVGEMNAVRPVIAALAAQTHVLVTATTVTGRATVKDWGLPQVTAQLAPLDWGWICRLVLRRANVRGLVIVENELWPIRISTAHKAGLPVVMINARMSQSSARTWGTFGKLAQDILGPMHLIAPQDSESAARLKALGGRNFMAPVNLKGAYTPTLTPIPTKLQSFKRAQTILAAATHAGEDAAIIAAFKALRQSHPKVQLIIAPRHPNRGPEVAKLCKDAGFSSALHSANGAPEADIYIADTLGEMHLWYRLAGVAFIGGSLVDKGGHTPFEPTAYGCPVLHGPHLSNFAEGYAKLHAAHAAVEVTDIATLTQAYAHHLGDDAMAMRAKGALGQPDLAPLLAKISAALDPDAQAGL